MSRPATIPSLSPRQTQKAETGSTCGWLASETHLVAERLSEGRKGGIIQQGRFSGHAEFQHEKTGLPPPPPSENETCLRKKKKARRKLDIFFICFPGRLSPLPPCPRLFFSCMGCCLIFLYIFPSPGVKGENMTKKKIVHLAAATAGGRRPAGGGGSVV